MYALFSNYDGLYVRRAPHMYGWDIMPRMVSAGIWRPVKLRYRPKERLESVFLETVEIMPDHGKASLCLHYSANTSGSVVDKYQVKVEAVCGPSHISETR